MSLVRYKYDLDVKKLMAMVKLDNDQTRIQVDGG